MAGLWLLDTLHQAGYAACLLTAGDLGAGQTIASQGIIHGGTKYTLGLGLESAVTDLAEMPARWRASLDGAEAPDLTAARPLADRMHFWVPPQRGGKLLAKASSKLMRGEMRPVAAAERPAGLATVRGGEMFALNEIVIDVPAVLAAFAARHGDRIRQLPAGEQLAMQETADGVSCEAAGVQIFARRVVFTAGAGNEALLARVGLSDIPCQRRPLHQVIIGGMATALFAHCVGKSSKPLATITSHPDGAGGQYWYVGGLLAEDGVAQQPAELIAAARPELSRLLPSVDFSAASWATYRIDRSEHGGGGGLRPSSAVALSRGAYIIGWPTKLALAPRLAEQILELLRQQLPSPTAADLDGLRALPRPAIAQPPWQQALAWN